MSWLNQNYEKAALGGAVVVALGLAFWGWSKVGAVENDFTADPRGSGPSDPSVAQADRVAQAQASLGMQRVWTPGDVEGRQVSLFTGVPLFVSRDDPSKVIDLVTGTQIHPPIPNAWWIENRLDPGFGDAPQRDPDEDGFTNLEEYTAGTDPNDPTSHPPLIRKLKFVNHDSLMWILRPSFQQDEGSFPFAYQDDRGGVNKMGAAGAIAPGELFFGAEPMQNRFKLLGHEVRKELNPRTNAEVTVTWVRVEDQRPNKAGMTYEFPAPFPKGREEELAQFDRTAILSLEAIGLFGQEFRVEENTRFSLPPKAGGNDYLLKTVTPQSITVEYAGEDGAALTVEIPLGGMPQ
jgi:hypothetical protein